MIYAGDWQSWMNAPHTRVLYGTRLIERGGMFHENATA